MKRILISFALLLSSSLALASNPIGYWQLNDSQGQPKYLIRLYQFGQTLSAKLIQFVPNPGAICTACTDEDKDKPYLGLTIIKGLKADGDNQWSGGEILNPETGKWSKVKLSINDSNDTLIINSYGWLGSWFGDKDIWTRRN